MTPRLAPPRHAPPARSARRRLTQLPVALVLLTMLAGLLTVQQHHFRVGCYLLALAMLEAAGLRLLLPTREAGLLAVRGRPLDVAVLLGLGLTVLVLTKVVPAG